ncbi:uncharacterized protein LOC141837620 [Curcuma longa]|uniref:uncharacterized protein LOC141837620 n=1 Tax=Curcuma longa TaxID=136217 RepID=UPI003D9EE853
MSQTPTRWCATPEQRMILEEMYRSGVRTPNASQIQQITARLSLYGKIEGKNVFYWFQNHKARERQKLRRRLGRKQPMLPVQPGDSTTTALQIHNQTNSQGCFQELIPQGMNLVGKLEAAQVHQAEEGLELWAGSCSSAGLPCCRPPLKTLDLFPTESTYGDER